MENKSDISELLDTMNEVVANLTALLNDVDKEIVKLAKEIKENDA